MDDKAQRQPRQWCTTSRSTKLKPANNTVDGAHNPGNTGTRQGSPDGQTTPRFTITQLFNGISSTNSTSEIHPLHIRLTSACCALSVIGLPRLAPIFSEQNLEITKHAIREEIRGTQDSVGRRLSTLETEQLFHNRSYRSTIGTISDIDSMTIEDVEKVYRAFYQSSNEIIVVAGNFKEKEMLEKITALYHELSFESHTIKRVLTEEPPTVRNKKAVLNFPTARPIFELSFKIPIGHLTGEQKLKLDWYMSIFFEMNFSILSPIVKKLKDRKVIDKNLVLSSNFFDDYLIVKIGSYTNKKEELEKEIFETLKHPRLDADVYELSIREKKLKVSLRPEKLNEVIDPFIDNLMYFDYPHLDSVAYLDTLSIQEYQEMISKLDFSNFVKTDVIDKNIDREQEEQQEFVAN